eukprot:CAMPEP_0113447510 /NCGR_PEP_ID=MMETSP0014_2-20120614/4272_1 /TAXON_ID=2857 /ORGANISM="Nitzschia sp." /LENGTH=294 /DNA_ID=CAMNT_0000338661 /DNA_START=477 /DNA_END=1358 /DNA_ORIENTATION=- /assembly_acc=CAM_ASM_000159
MSSLESESRKEIARKNNRDRQARYRAKRREDTDKDEEHKKEASQKRKKQRKELQDKNPRGYEDKVLRPNRENWQKKAKEAREKIHDLDAANVQKHTGQLCKGVFQSFGTDYDEERAKQILKKIAEKEQPDFGLVNGEKKTLNSGWEVYLDDDDGELKRQTTKLACYSVFANPLKKPKPIGACLVSPAIILQRTQRCGNVWSVMPRKAVYIDYLFVHPKCRRKGCGKQILDKMLEDLQSSGVDYVFLNATQDAYVVKIYTDRGFVPANEHVNAPFPLSETTARMNKYMMKILFDD